MSTKGEKTKKLKKRWRYFFVDGRLHKMLRLNRATDEVLAWCYEDRCKMVYSWSAVKKYGEPGYSTVEVAEMVNRHRISLLRYIHQGQIKSPQKTYIIPDGEVTKTSSLIWSRADIMGLHKQMGMMPVSGFRKDGFVHKVSVPSVAELRAHLDHGMKLYTLNTEGKMVRVWEAEGEQY